jgi:hypothetical protein
MAQHLGRIRKDNGNENQSTDKLDIPDSIN